MGHLHDSTIDEFDRALGQLDGLPGALQTKPSTIQVVGLLGAAKTFIVRTVRQQTVELQGEKEVASRPTFTVFLEHYGQAHSTRLVLPDRVCELIARQRDALTSQARRKTAKRVAAENKRRGIVPGFMRGGKKGKAKK